MQALDFNTTKSLRVARGGAVRLAALVQELGCRRALVVTDEGLLRAGLLEAPLAGFAGLGLGYQLFSGVTADPPESIIHAAVAAVRESGADCVVGFGGGSSMDAAKLAALLAGGSQPLSEAYGVGNAKGPRLPLILVPTTAGTGSEVTPISIVTTGEGEKKGVVSPVLLPDIALLDAELTLGLPGHITAATGIDAMVHAIEAFTTARLKNPISDCLALQGLCLLAGSIHQACAVPSDIQAREDMLLGACLAGMAFANAPVAAVHALAYPVGARFHVAHGLSNSLVLAPVLRFNLPSTTQLYAQLGDAIAPVSGTETERAEAFIRRVSGLAAQLGLPTRLRDVGISAADIPLLAADAMKQTRLLVNNPRPVNEQDAATLYLEAL